MLQVPEVITTHTDPVCGMSVSADEAEATAQHAGETYYFCSIGCRDKFVAAPTRWLQPKQQCHTAPVKSASPDRGGIEYTCPMHPEVVQIGPGSCHERLPRKSLRTLNCGT
jgi:Cu+-exporting ATPase